MGNYNDSAEREIERQKKGKGKVAFKPVIYGSENRCPNCWSVLIEHEANGHVTRYCFNCYTAAIK